ncbi:MAG: hypothetical protein OXG13_11135 [Gemmatimonadaceae bacterium]|nr:hypothetical protein [Gemmatimonadaceae bacterium]
MKLSLEDEIVHGTDYGSVECLGKAHSFEVGYDQPLEDESVVVCPKELTNVARDPIQEATVIGNASAIHHHGVEGCRVGDQDVLSSVGPEQVGRPVGEGIGIGRKNPVRALVDFPAELG